MGIVVGAHPPPMGAHTHTHTHTHGDRSAGPNSTPNGDRSEEQTPTPMRVEVLRGTTPYGERSGGHMHKGMEVMGPYSIPNGGRSEGRNSIWG